MADPKTLLAAARSSALRTLASSKLFNAPPSKAPQSKIGMPPGPLNRNQAQAPEPVAKSGGGDIRLSATTYFTKAPAPGAEPSILYSGDRMWARVIVTLETAGPVAVGFVSGLSPVTSGNGILLTTGVPVTFDIAKGNRLYIAATSVNRVKVQIQPLPWMEQIAGTIVDFGKMLASFLAALTGGGQ